MKPTIAELEVIIIDFNKNIPERKINTALDNAIDIDMVNALPAQLLTDIKSLQVLVEEEVDTRPELRAFYNQYFKRIWANFAWARILTTHGKNVTPFGIQHILDQDASVVDNRDVITMVNAFMGDATTLLSQSKVYLKERSYTLDNINYNPNNSVKLSPKNKTRFIGI